MHADSCSVHAKPACDCGHDQLVDQAVAQMRQATGLPSAVVRPMVLMEDARDAKALPRLAGQGA